MINCASSSAPFINRLSAPDRVVVTATKSGYELNYARFGDYLSAPSPTPAADLDKDEQTSLLEAFLLASGRVAEFYEQEARLATETALIDDNGDGQGTPAAWFRGVRAVRRAKTGRARTDRGPISSTSIRSPPSKTHAAGASAPAATSWNEPSNRCVRPRARRPDQDDYYARARSRSSGAGPALCNAGGG